MIDKHIGARSISNMDSRSSCRLTRQDIYGNDRILSSAFGPMRRLTLDPTEVCLKEVSKKVSAGADSSEGGWSGSAAPAVMRDDRGGNKSVARCLSAGPPPSSTDK